MYTTSMHVSCMYCMYVSHRQSATGVSMLTLHTCLLHCRHPYIQHVTICGILELFKSFNLLVVYFKALGYKISRVCIVYVCVCGVCVCVLCVRVCVCVFHFKVACTACILSVFKHSVTTIKLFIYNYSLCM